MWGIYRGGASQGVTWDGPRRQPGMFHGHSIRLNTRTSSRVKAPSAGVCLLDRVELPVSGSSESCVDGSREDDEETDY